MRRAVALLVLLAAGGLSAGENLMTVRLGEQDSCKFTGLTKVASSDGGATAQFDLSGLKGIKAVRAAVLRMWVDLDPRRPMGKAFSVSRWNEADFDGFKVWQVGGPQQPLDVVYPFTTTYFACHEWNVTAAVKAWLANPADNKGLRTNFALPANDSDPAWQRPYLQITFEGPNPDRPRQPTELKAFCRAGQVFITWKQIPHTGAFFDSTYRIYRHCEPVTAANLDQAQLLGEVHRLSQLNYRRTAWLHGGLGPYNAYGGILAAYLGVEKTRGMTEAEYVKLYQTKLPKRVNFVINDAWPRSIEQGAWLQDAKLLGRDKRLLEGPQLSDDTGLFVYTVPREGQACFAVTSVVNGNENRQDFAAGNALPGPVNMSVEQPRAVLQVVYHMRNAPRPHNPQIREYTFWGGGEAADPLHNESSTPFYFRIDSPPWLVGVTRGDAEKDSFTELAPWWSGRPATIKVDSIYLPPTRLAPFPPRYVGFGYWDAGWDIYSGAADGKPTPTASTGGWGAHGLKNGYGYHNRVNTGKDPRQARVFPYMENQQLRGLEHFFQEFPQASRDRVVASAEGEAMIFGIHHPEAIATVNGAMDAPWSAPAQTRQWVYVGKREWKLKNDKDVNVWDWNDPVWYARQFPTRVWPFITTMISCNYSASDNLSFWKNYGQPEFYLNLAKDRRGGQWGWSDAGDDPGGTKDRVPRNMAYPAFTNVNFAETPAEEWKLEPRGSPNGYLKWHTPDMPFRPDRGAATKPAVALDLVDVPDRFELAVRIGDKGLGRCPPTAARYGKTDITLWRLQQFKIEEGKPCIWQNRKAATGQVLQTGAIQPDDRGLLTVPGFYVDRDPPGNKLIIEPAEGRQPPAIDKNAKIGELTYAEYVKACENPVLMPEVKGPAVTLRLTDFTAPGHAVRNGLATWTGGGFSSSWSTRFLVTQSGHYVISVRAKAQRGVNWPLLGLGLDHAKITTFKPIDGAEYALYRWYVDLPPGRKFLELATPNEYYMSGWLPDLRKSLLTIADVTFTQVPDEEAKQPEEIRLSPVSIAVPVGMPIRMAAQVLDGLGAPAAAQVSWKCNGAKIDGSGLLLAEKPGNCTVTALAGTLTAATTLWAGEKFVEDFNEGSGYLNEAWSIQTLDGAAASWRPPPAGHRMLTCCQVVMKAPGQSVLLWQPGSAMRNASIQADVIVPGDPQGQAMPARLVHGLVVRATGKHSHYRLEVERRADGSAARLVKRVDGKDKVLATADKPPELAPFDYATNPCCPGWHDLTPKEAQNHRLEDWRLDRLRLQVNGDRLQAWINGKAVLAEPVKEGALAAGAPGLFSATEGWFDNVEIQAPKD